MAKCNAKWGRANILGTCLFLQLFEAATSFDVRPYLGDGEPSTVALLLRTVEGTRISDSFATGNFRPLTSVRG